VDCAESIKVLEVDLATHLGKLEAKFIQGFFPVQPQHKPADYEHEVKAFCVLAHAAFEEYAEQVSMLIMRAAIDAWRTQREVTDPLISLCLFYKVEILHVDDEKQVQPTCFDLMRVALENAKALHSTAIHKNHGFSLKYLRAALTPVFINVPSRAKFDASLKTLAAARGSFAHGASRDASYSSTPQGRKADRSIAPEEARAVVADCLELCREIGLSATVIAEVIEGRARTVREKLDYVRSSLRERRRLNRPRPPVS
jgi:hypothetical protein